MTAKIPNTKGGPAGGPQPQPAFRHFILFNFRDEVPEREREEALTALRRLEELPMVRAYRVLRNLRDPQHRPPTGFSPPLYFEWICSAEFADRAAREEYGRDPTHFQVVARQVRGLVKDLAAFDVEY